MAGIGLKLALEGVWGHTIRRRAAVRPEQKNCRVGEQENFRDWAAGRGTLEKQAIMTNQEKGRETKMVKRIWLGVLGLAVVLVAGLGAMAWGQQGPVGKPTAANPGPAEPTGTVILNTFGMWRFYCEIAPPVTANGETATLKHVWLNYRTPAVAKDWMAPDFDDWYWNRGPVTLACKTAMLAKVCLRGKFTVTDSAAVKGLSLSVGYRGGLIVYVNGKEVKREHIEAGKSLAEGPPCVDCNLTGLAIPSNLLRKGMNVIGLEVVRAPYAEKAADGVYEQNSCQILRRG